MTDDNKKGKSSSTNKSSSMKQKSSDVKSVKSKVSASSISKKEDSRKKISSTATKITKSSSSSNSNNRSTSQSKKKSATPSIDKSDVEYDNGDHYSHNYLTVEDTVDDSLFSNHDHDSDGDHRAISPISWDQSPRRSMSPSGAPSSKSQERLPQPPSMASSSNKMATEERRDNRQNNSRERRNDSHSNQQRPRRPFGDEGGSRQGAIVQGPHLPKKIEQIFKDARYYLIKSNNYDNVDLAKARSVWATPRSNEDRLNRAFREANNVLLVFSVKESGRFQGYARVASPSDKNLQMHWVLPHGMSNRQLSGGFKIDWISKTDVSFNNTFHILNQWNENKPVKIGRDGQELEPRCGETLCRLFLVDDDRSLDNAIQRSRGEQPTPQLQLANRGPSLLASPPGTVRQPHHHPMNENMPNHHRNPHRSTHSGGRSSRDNGPEDRHRRPQGHRNAPPPPNPMYNQPPTSHQQPGLLGNPPPHFSMQPHPQQPPPNPGLPPPRHAPPPNNPPQPQPGQPLFYVMGQQQPMSMPSGGQPFNPYQQPPPLQQLQAPQPLPPPPQQHPHMPPPMFDPYQPQQHAPPQPGVPLQPHFHPQGPPQMPPHSAPPVPMQYQPPPPTNSHQQFAPPMLPPQHQQPALMPYQMDHQPRGPFPPQDPHHLPPQQPAGHHLQHQPQYAMPPVSSAASHHQHLSMPPAGHSQMPGQAQPMPQYQQPDPSQFQASLQPTGAYPPASVAQGAPVYQGIMQGLQHGLQQHYSTANGSQQTLVESSGARYSAPQYGGSVVKPEDSYRLPSSPQTQHRPRDTERVEKKRRSPALGGLDKDAFMSMNYEEYLRQAALGTNEVHHPQPVEEKQDLDSRINDFLMGITSKDKKVRKRRSRSRSDSRTRRRHYRSPSSSRSRSRERR